MSEQQALKKLTQWFEKNSIKWSKECISITKNNGSYSVHALKSMKRSEIAVKIPKNSILSTKTSGISKILDVEIESSYLLVLAVLYEIAQKEESPWFEYLGALPKISKDLPMFWEEDEKKLFKSTSMEGPVYNDLDDIKDDYYELIEPFLNSHPDVFNSGNNSPYSFENFVNIYTLISSRAFLVDTFHDKALVPFADLFNYCEKKGNVDFKAKFDVCNVCGELDYCEHQYNGIFEDEASIGNEDQYDNELENEPEESDDTDEDSSNEPLDLEEFESQSVDFWDIDEGKKKRDYCDIVIHQDIEKGEEIFNTYRDLTSAELLSKYGFCFENNQNDEIAISEDDISKYYISLTTKLFKSKDKKGSETLAIEKTRLRRIFFLKNEKILFPDSFQEETRKNLDDHKQEYDYKKDCRDNGMAESEIYLDENENNCCDNVENLHRLYSINFNGIFENRAIYLLHIMFVDDDTFKKFNESIDFATQYFDELLKPLDKKRKIPNQVMVLVYKACYEIAKFKNNECQSIEKDFEEREKTLFGSRKYYAFTYRINEKKIIEKCINHYSSLTEHYNTALKTDTGLAKKQRKD